MLNRKKSRKRKDRNGIFSENPCPSRQSTDSKKHFERHLENSTSRTYNISLALLPERRQTSWNLPSALRHLRSQRFGNVVACATSLLFSLSAEFGFTVGREDRAIPYEGKCRNRNSCIWLGPTLVFASLPNAYASLPDKFCREAEVSSSLDEHKQANAVGTDGSKPDSVDFLLQIGLK